MLGIMGKAKKERTCQMKISNWRKIIYGKLKGTKMNHLECFFCERKVHQLVLKDKIPCPHSSCEKDPQVFQRNGISPLHISSNRFNSTPTLSFCANIITPSMNSWSSSSFFNTAWYCCKTTAASF